MNDELQWHYVLLAAGYAFYGSAAIASEWCRSAHWQKRWHHVSHGAALLVATGCMAVAAAYWLHSAGH